MRKLLKKMMLRINMVMCIVLVLFFAGSKLIAQDTLWTKTYGGIDFEFGRSVIEVSSGGFLIAGKTSSYGAGSWDFYLIRTDDDGDTLWTKTYGGNRDDIAYDVIEVSSGGFLITGRTISFGAGGSDIYLIRTDANGDTLWTRTYGRTSNEEGRAGIEVSSGGFLIAGTTEVQYSTDFWLIRTDSLGNTLWTKTYDGGGDDVCYDVCETSSGGFVITGRAWGPVYSYAWVIKTDVFGETIWEHAYEEEIGGEVGHDVIECSDGSYVVVGTGYNRDNSSYDITLIKIDNGGNRLWSRKYGGDNKQVGYSVAEALTGGLIITGVADVTTPFGSRHGDVYMIRTDASGDTLWTRTYGGTGNDIGYSVISCAAGGFAVTGYLSSDVLLLRVDDHSVDDIKEETQEQIYRSYSLEQNYPNPFNSTTIVSYSLPTESKVKIEITNILGQKVRILVNDKKSAGHYKTTWDAGNLPSGIYFISIMASGINTTESFTQIRKALLLK